MRCLTFAWLAILCLLLCPSLLGQSTPSNLQVTHEQWTFRDGAPQAIAALAQTSDGFLWIGSESGLVRFDGVRFEPFRSPFGDQLLSNSIFSLFAPERGGLWIGYQLGGFSFVERGRITSYAADAATGTVWQFAQGPDGVLWAATTTGLWKFDGSSWQKCGPEWKGPSNATDVGFDREGTLWVLNTPRLFALAPHRREFELVMKDVPGYDTLTVDADGHVVTAAANFPGTPAGSYPVFGNGSLAFIDRMNSLWIDYRQRELSRVPFSQATSFQSLAKSKQRDTYKTNLFPVQTRLVDREGGVWFGGHDGLHLFTYSQLMKQDFGGKAVNAVAATDGPDVYVSSSRGGYLYRVRDGRAQIVNRMPECQEALAMCEVQTVYVGRDKTVWYSADHLWRRIAGNWVKVSLPREMEEKDGHYLQSIAEDAQGRTWISFGRHGLYQWMNGTWTRDGGRTDMPQSGVVIQATDARGRVWFGYANNKLAVLDGDRLQVFDESRGLRLGKIMAVFGRGKTIWVSGDLGMQRVQDDRIYDVSSANPDLLRGVSGIVETADGDLWLNGLSGIVHIRQSEVSESLKDAAYQIKGELIGRRQGLPGLPEQLRPLPTATQTGDGRLWFTESGSLVWLDPHTHNERRMTPPAVSIQSVFANDKAYSTGLPLSFPAKTSSVQINYSGVSLSEPGAIRFRYKLQETDKDWHEVSSASSVTYRNLAPGLYHFTVNTSGTDGLWSDQVEKIEFRLLPAFYQTRWFVVLCGAATMVIIWGLYQLRLHQLRRHFNVALEERVGERTRIARDLHDTLLQSLHGLMFQYQAARNMLPRTPEKAIEVLDDAILGTERAIAEGRDAIQDLRPQTVAGGDLPELLKATCEERSSARNGEEPRPSFQVIVEGEPRTLSVLAQDEAYRIAREVIRNAYEHADATRIEVEIRYGEHELRLRVRDDGKGFDAKIVEESTRAGHWGLPGIRERAQKVGARLEIWTQGDAGTEVQLAIPAAIAYDRSTRSRPRRFRKATAS